MREGDLGRSREKKKRSRREKGKERGKKLRKRRKKASPSKEHENNEPRAIDNTWDGDQSRVDQKTETWGKRKKETKEARKGKRDRLDPRVRRSSVSTAGQSYISYRRRGKRKALVSRRGGVEDSPFLDNMRPK